MSMDNKERWSVRMADSVMRRDPEVAARKWM
jgi:hypothetical protein